jgi:hypothetical protein
MPLARLHYPFRTLLKPTATEIVTESALTSSGGSPARRHDFPLGQADLELAKWLAAGAMVIDHYGKIVEPSLYLETHAIGRIAFPLFATVIGMRLALNPHLAASYVKRLLPWAVISQPVFVLAGRNWHEGNILLTLLLGVLATMLIRRYADSQSPSELVGIMVLIPLAWFMEFGVIGVVMIPITVELAAWRRLAGLSASGPIGLAANMTLSWPPLQFADAPAILASFIALACAKAKVTLPRLPVHVFYGFYPAHLMALHLLDLAT